MLRYSLKCKGCGNIYESSYENQLCGKCGSNLEVVYERGKGFKIDGCQFWDYIDYLPDGKYRRYLVGGTRLIDAGNGLQLKLETTNPTRSFKDRGSVIEVAKAMEYGYSELSCASTGNMAYSLSYYCGIEGLGIRVFISRDANRYKLDLIKGTGTARIVKVYGDFNLAMKNAEKYAKSKGAFVSGDYCYRKEGQKTIAYEVAAQSSGFDNIVVPIGNATLISGIGKALAQMLSSGAIKRMPRIIGVQASGSAPVAKAFAESSVPRYVKPNTMADAIAVGYPTFGAEALEAIRKTKGKVVTVTDSEMKAEQKFFLKEYGLLAEMSGVASIAAYRKLRLRGSRTVAIISGANLEEGVEFGK